MHFTHSYIHLCLSFVYMYSFLVTSYILLTYIFMYFISLSYLMTYTYTFLYLYVLLVLYQTVLSHVGVQNIDFFFNNLRYPSCPNYLPLYLFFYTPIHIKSTSITISCSYVSLFLSCIPIDFTQAISTLGTTIIFLDVVTEYHLIAYGYILDSMIFP